MKEGALGSEEEMSDEEGARKQEWREGGRKDAGARKGKDDPVFKLELERIRSGEDTRTTLMIRNIPNKYD